MEKLLPIKVPWQLCVTCSNAALHVYETGSTNLSFMAYLIAEHGSATEHRVDIEFNAGHWVRVQPSIGDEGPPFDDSLYDLSALEFDALMISDFDRWTVAFRSQWSKGICPDPNVYRVERSEWLKSLPTDYSESEYIHYLFACEDVLIQVLSRGLTWRIEDAGVSGTA
jgi:hypothetical protein